MPYVKNTCLKKEKQKKILKRQLGKKTICVINSCIIILFSEDDIQQLMAYIRSKFKDTSFPPKLHMLGEHVVEFIRKVHFPLGFFGEQGGESIHHEFEQLAST